MHLHNGSTDQGHIVHAQHDNSLVLGTILAPPTHVRFDDISSVLGFESVGFQQ